jgi:hypothetical protein
MDPVLTCMMLYMSAENDLGDFASFNLKSIKRATPLSRMALYIVHDHERPGGVGGTDEYIVGQTDEIFEPRPIFRDKEITDKNVFRWFLHRSAQTLNRHQPKHKILCLWGHGGGLVMLNEDQTSTGPALQTGVMEFAKVLSESRDVAGFNIILFDACYMSMIETLNEFHRITTFILASSAKVPATSFPYGEILSRLKGKEQHEEPEVVAEFVRTSYNEAYESPGSVYRLFICKADSIRDCSRRLNELGAALLALIEAAGLDAFTPMLQATLERASMEEGYVPVLAFLKHLTESIATFSAPGSEKSSVLSSAAALRASVLASFSGELTDEGPQPSSPVIWTPIERARFDKHEARYAELQCSKEGGEWLGMWRKLHTVPVS